MPQVAIYRHQLFKFSEPFITQQAGHLRKFNPTYLGRVRLGAGPVDASSLVLEDLPAQRTLHRRVWQVVTRDPRPFVELMGEYRPSLIHAHFGVEGVYALPLARVLGIPLVTTFHGFDATTSKRGFLRSGSPSWIKYAISRKELAREGDLFLCVSEFIRECVLALGFPAERTRVHYIGVDTQAIQVRDPLDETPTILHVARLVEKKGTEYLIRAFGLTASRWPETELVIIGTGPLKADLEALTKSLGLLHRVRFLGALAHPQVMSRMAKACMLVLPSVLAKTGDAEGLGMVLVEAAATGVPVIGTLHGGIPEAIVDERTGYLVAERDSDSLADRMERLLADPAGRLEMGARARVMAEARFDIIRQTEELEELYRGVLR